MEMVLDNLIYVAVVLFFAYVLYSMFTKAGKGRMLGGTIINTSSEEIVQKSGMLTTTIRTYVIESNTKNKHIGLEISEGEKLGASFKPVKLSKSEAEKFIRMLNEAISKT